MRRMWWLGAGYVAGLGTAAWLRSKAREAAERYAPANVRNVVAERSQEAANRARETAVDGAKNLGREARRIADDVRQAVVEGREAMRRAESELVGEDEPLSNDERSHDPGPTRHEVDDRGRGPQGLRRLLRRAGPHSPSLGQPDPP